MAITAFPSAATPDLALLNVARLFTRLEHNLLSPGADRRSFQQSEYQRMRNVDYARSLLTQLERSLPQIKPLNRKHEAQAEIARDRQLLKRIQTILDEEDAKAEAKEDEEDETDDIDDIDDEWKELFSKPVAQKAISPVSRLKDHRAPTRLSDSPPEVKETSEAQQTTMVSATATTTTPTPVPTSISLPAPPTLRNRHTTHPALPSSSEKATATGSNTKKLSETEAELSTHRLEQEDLTSSLLTLASRLKSSTQSFQAMLEGENWSWCGVGHRPHKYYNGGSGQKDGDVAQNDGGEGAVGADDALRF
ncbi:hypothetical protein PDIDSM_407 [Penicillium digitatum]|nr:hypothetical protein PDIDSM_407 [Penicillium digitatum]